MDLNQDKPDSGPMVDAFNHAKDEDGRTLCRAMACRFRFGKYLRTDVQVS